MKMNSVVHFEMPYEDKQRMADFYGEAFGWQTSMLGPEMGNYVVVTTTATDPATRMIKEPGRINGGFFQKAKNASSTTVVIAVDDIQDAMEQVKKAGGKVIGGSKGEDIPDEVPGVGLYAAIIDTEGNRVGMLQPR
jgi:predicted enzyme related to lactoylglutathione lyase